MLESNDELDEVKPAIFARFGKILFHLIISGVAPKIGFDVEEDKDIFHVLLSDSTKPKNSDLYCKCRMKEDKKLELYKVETNQICEMSKKILCIDKNLDLMLTLETKRILTSLTDDEMHIIGNIINSAVIDPEVMGGLRWPYGKACFGDRFAVVEIWHTIAKKYKSPSLSLMAKHVDRFNFEDAYGQESIEVYLKLKRLVADLQIVRKNLEYFNELNEEKPALVARFGKILFQGRCTKKRQGFESTLKRMRKIFCAPSSYMENFISGVAPKIGFDLEEDKDIFHILLSDSSRPKKSTLYCKCRIKEDKKLELYKAFYAYKVGVFIVMAYIPPHKRHSKDSEMPSPIPERLVPQFSRQVNLKSSSNANARNVSSVRSMYIVGLDADNQFPSSVHLEPTSVEYFKQRMFKNPPFVLVNSHPATKEIDEEGEAILSTPMETISSTPWESVAVDIWPKLLSAFEIVRDMLESNNELDEVKPAMVARFGKILFHPNASLSSESLIKDRVAETTLRQMKTTFYTNTPSLYMENIISGVAPKIGFDLEEDKDMFHIVDDEMHGIRNIINSAIIDPEVKGGLRWPYGKACSGDRFAVVEIWHTIAKKYKSRSLSLMNMILFVFTLLLLLHATMYPHVLINFSFKFQEEKVETDSIFEMFKDNLKMIWVHFLCWDQYFP
ncbi:hypothetical protein EZV62_007500 [Acer yangbiense]|uniref:DUF7903 domain-containing protein n=1 Tax=Acer yangbiense TaxID=1000413 RepID=A0A5C7IAG8_9ROSI|nr:hypothetical protein EZV62_007500 [Acer yangbiense]